MAVVLALTKGRSSSSVLLSICRQWCAYTLAADIYPHVRWVPSQRNAADDSSRNRSRHLVDSDVAESQITLWAASKDRKIAKEAKRNAAADCNPQSHAEDDKSIIKAEPKSAPTGTKANEDEDSEPSKSRPRCPKVPVTSELVKAIQRRLDEATKILQKVADVRLKKYGSEKKVKAKEKSFLERRSVQVPVERDYRNRYLQFTTWSKRANMSTSTVADIDEALTLLMNENFFEGRQGTDGKKMLAALGYCVPLLTRGSPELVRAREAAIGWKKLSPAFARLPTPWPVVCMLIYQLIKMRCEEAAQAVALTFVLYLRPSETLGLTAACLAPPAHLGRTTTDKWCITLHPSEAAVASKTGEFDCSLMVDNPDFPFMPALLSMLKLRGQNRSAQLTTRIFSITYRQWSAQYAEAARLLTLENFGSSGYHLLPVLYQLRHGGASHELATGRREITALAKRGRWASIASLRRYEKGGRLTELVSRLSPAQVVLAEDCQSRIGDILCGTFPVTSHSTDRSFSQVPADGRPLGGRLPRPAGTTASSST